MSDICPECGSVATQKGVKINGDSARVEVEWWSCLSCEWDNKSNSMGEP